VSGMASAGKQTWIAASLAKAGNRADENEDATAADAAGSRFAVADGATEGWESRGWAAALAAAFVRRPPAPDGFTAWLTEARAAWTPPPLPSAAPWYAAAKRAEGAFATLVGLELAPARRKGHWKWKAVAVGDSCLFVHRGVRMEMAFPIGTVAGFGSHPALVPSSPAAECLDPEWLAGRAEPGDLFLLASDAVAAHLLALEKPEAWGPLLAAIDDGLSTGDPKSLLDWLHSIQPARNDDLTLLAIRPTATPE